MHDQAKYEALEASTFYADGKAARDLVPNTVPRGFLRADQAYYTGLDASGQGIPGFPVETLKAKWGGNAEELSEQEFSRVVLRRGQQRYGMFCTPCHGAVGAGNGMIVQRGFQVPTSFHDERLRTSPPGYIFNVMTEGFGQMSSYARQITPEDRWAIAAYVRTLQFSQSARTADLNPADLQRLDEPPAADGHSTGGHGAGGHGDAGQGAADDQAGDDPAVGDHGGGDHQNDAQAGVPAGE
jgi:mono/diheme cytochrome c family protein